MDNFLVIDGNSLLHRSYHGVKPLSNKDGVFTQAIFGFLNTYFSLDKQYKPTYVAVAFDTDKPTFRKDMYEDYKGNRTKMPDDLVRQFGYTKEILKSLGIQCIECPGYEADDILGTIANMCEENHLQCNIVSGDRDVFQLIGETTKVVLLRAKKQEYYDVEAFVEKYGFKPEYLVDYKAIAGDSSDNYYGIRGLGDRTATPLVQTYGTLENIYQNLANLKVTPRVLGLLQDKKEDAYLCRCLATIKRNVPITTDLETYRYHGIADKEKLLEILQYLEMKSFISRLKLEEDEYSLPRDEEDEASKTPKITVETISEEFKPKQFSNDYILKDGKLYIRDGAEDNVIYVIEDENLIINYLESDVYKRTISAKEHYRITSNLKNVSMDAEISGYLLDTSAKEYTVKSLCERYEVAYFDRLGEYADIYSLPLLNDAMSTRVYDLELADLEKLELRVTEVLADMESTGIKVDVPTVESYQNELSKILHELETSIYVRVGHKFKILSPKQLGDVLFEEMGLPPVRKKLVGYCTDNKVLEKLKYKDPIIQMVMDYRFYHKLKSTYLDGLLNCVDSDGKIHTVFRQTETRTGRLSSAEPNLQNIPIRNEFAKNIRKFFVAHDDHVLIDADYNQMELRITASLSHDKNMINNFLNGKDVHTTTAIKLFERDSADQVTPQMRSIAKSINFGVIYGMGAKKLSEEVGIIPSDAKAYINDYFEMYPDIKEYKNTLIEGCRLTGYVRTILNRIRYVPEIYSTGMVTRASGERIAMNTPIQGSSADIMKLAMVNVYDRLKKENLDAKLILQVHDELLLESHKSCADRVAEIVKDEMENAIKLEVPLTVEVKTGDSWFDAH